ncbi:MAG TPA: hypothetical protein PKV71_20620, partial [Calditrichia bacterium]|nr:hypothetical protein [Calditrichia bacterium]
MNPFCLSKYGLNHPVRKNTMAHIIDVDTVSTVELRGQEAALFSHPIPEINHPGTTLVQYALSQMG